MGFNSSWGPWGTGLKRLWILILTEFITFDSLFQEGYEGKSNSSYVILSRLLPLHCTVTRQKAWCRPLPEPCGSLPGYHWSVISSWTTIMAVMQFRWHTERLPTKVFLLAYFHEISRSRFRFCSRCRFRFRSLSLSFSLSLSLSLSLVLVIGPWSTRSLVWTILHTTFKLRN